MSTSAANAAGSAAGVAWDLSDLYAGPQDPQLDADMSVARERAQGFRDQFEGRVAELDAAAMQAALTDLEGLTQLADRPLIFAHLLHAADSSDPVHGALVARTAEANSQVRAGLLFFELEMARAARRNTPIRSWPIRRSVALPTSCARGWPSARTYWSARSKRPLKQKANTGARAFSRLFDEVN